MSVLEKIAELCIAGLLTDGAHHKQWYLEEIFKLTGVKLGVDELKGYMWDEGIPS